MFRLLVTGWIGLVAAVAMAGLPGPGVLPQNLAQGDGKPSLAAGSLAGRTNEAGWPQFRGPVRDGRSPETGLLDRWPAGGPKLLWSVQGVGKGFTHATISGGLVYVSGLVGKQGVLHAYTTDGKLRWQAEYGAEWEKNYPGARGVPTVYDGRVYIASGFGTVSCFDAVHGTPLWAADLRQLYGAPEVFWGFAESVLVDGDSVICTPCGKKATMVALDRKTGRHVWASPALGLGSSFCSPLLIEHRGTRMLITLTETAAVAFSPADGTLLWQYPYEHNRTSHPNTPIYHDGILYIASGYAKGAMALALADDGRSVKEIWRQPRQDPAHGQAVLVDGYVYASSNQAANGKWSCVELTTGKLAWEAPGVGKGGSVVYADGLLYCYAEDGTVGLVRPRPDACEVVSSFKPSLGDGPHWAHLAIAQGRLYIRHGDTLMCYEISATLPRRG